MRRGTKKLQSANPRDSALRGFAPRHNPQNASHPHGFSLLEMMMVVTVILIVASIATPI
jgi:prepilin-type N-terminal cleavage/methylation domain-containing protein